MNTPRTAGDFAASSAEPVGQGHSLEREGDLGSPSGGHPVEGGPRTGLRGSRLPVHPHSLTARWV